MTTETNADDPISIALNKALLELSKKHGIGIPEDDPLIALTLLNSEILKISVQESLKEPLTIFRDFHLECLSNLQHETKKSIKAQRVSRRLHYGISITLGVLLSINISLLSLIYWS